MKITDWDDDEYLDTDEPDDVSYWSENYTDHEFGLTPEQADWSVQPDKNVLRAERHQSRKRRQERERKVDEES